MNILMINKTDRRGGAAKIAWDLKTALTAQGHTVDFFVDNKTSGDKNVFTIPRPKWLFYLSHLLGTDINLFKTDYLLATEEFKRADIIHVHNLHGHYFNLKTLVKMSQLKPVVWTLHDLWAVTPYCSQAPGKKLNKGFYTCPVTSSKSIMKYFNQFCLRARKRRLYQNLSVHLVAPSLWLKNKITDSVLAKQPLSLIHHGLEIARKTSTNKQALRQALGLPLNKKIVLFVASGGRTNLWKGWRYAERAMLDLKNRTDVLFLCIGGQGQASTLANLKFIDYLEDEAVLAKYFEASDAFLLTSVAESFALVILEALAAGLPIVSFPVGVAPEVIKQGVNGYLAKSANSSDLVRGVKEVLDFDQRKLQQLREINQIILEPEFSLATMTQKYLSLFEQLIKKS